jgi:UV DNA damage endonuclease
MGEVDLPGGALMRLGFAVKVLGQPHLKTNDSRRWQNAPHLSVSLAYVRDVLVYLRRVGIRMYRLSSDLAPYVTHPDMPQFHRQVEECQAELAEIGRLAHEDDVRLSFHPSQYIVLSSPNDGIAAKSMADIESQASMLEVMGLDHRAVVVIHVGGIYDDRAAAMDRFVARWQSLSESAQRRLVLENDERSYGVSDTRQIHERTGIRLIFDYLHFLNHHPAEQKVRDALAACLDTWPATVTPKVHFSSPRTEMRVMEQRDPATDKTQRVLKPPLWTQHADFINPFEFVSFLEQVQGLRDFDIMLETKAKDLALLRLREDLRTLAPTLVAQFNM